MHSGSAVDNLFDSSQPLLHRQGFYQWGPDLPNDFVDARGTPRRLWTVIKAAMKDKAEKDAGSKKKASRNPGREWPR